MIHGLDQKLNDCISATVYSIHVAYPQHFALRIVINAYASWEDSPAATARSMILRIITMSQSSSRSRSQT